MSLHRNDFPAHLALALDVVRASGDDAKAAALVLGCSPSQLIKLLKEAPRGLGLINQRRRQAGRTGTVSIGDSTFPIHLSSGDLWEVVHSRRGG